MSPGRRTLHVHQHAPGLRHDDGGGGEVPAVDPRLVVRLHAARRHVAHVDGGRACPTQAGREERERETQGEAHLQ